MAQPKNMAGLSVATDLGLGDMLAGQRDDQIDEQERRRRLGLSTLGVNPLDFGMTGIASADLGMGSAGRR